MELALQATCSTQQGYNLLAPKFEATPYATPRILIASCLRRWSALQGGLEIGAQAADLASGTGRGVEALLRLGFSVEAFDFSQGMLDQLSSKFSPWISSGRLQAIKADLSTLELTPERYSLITCFGAWGHILEPWRDRFLEQVLTGLAPGGSFLTITADPSPILSLRRWKTWAFDHAIRLRNATLPESFHMYYGINDTVTLRNALVPLAPTEHFSLALEPIPGALHRELTLMMLTRRK